jgi:hypothetical protein
MQAWWWSLLQVCGHAHKGGLRKKKNLRWCCAAGGGAAAAGAAAAGACLAGAVGCAPALVMNNLLCSAAAAAASASASAAAAGNYQTSLRSHLPADCPAVAAVTALDGSATAPAVYSNWLPVAGAAADDMAHTFAAPGGCFYFEREISYTR